MAVSTDNAFSGPYITNGSTTVFPFTFTAPSADEVSVTLRDEDGEDTIATGYTVSLTDGGGGSVTFASAPESGFDLYVLMSPLFTQDITFENGSAWRAEPVNEGYDRAAARDQALKRDVARAFKAPMGSTGLEVVDLADGQVLALVGGKVRGVDNDPASAADSAEQALAAKVASETARDIALGAQGGAENAQEGAEDARAGAIAAALASQLYYPGARDYVPRGLTAVAITAAGSGGTNGTYICPLTGDDLSVDAYASVTVAGGIVTAVSPSAPGLYIGASPTPGLVDTSSITGLTGATLTPTIGYLKTSGQYYLTDHASDTNKASLFQNQANAAVEVVVSVGWLDISAAIAAAATAVAAAANIGLSTQTTIDIIDTDQDEDGRWWVQRLADGVTRIQKLADGQGRRLDTLIDSNTSRIATLEAANLMQPPIQRLRLKKALYYSSLQTRQVSASDPITVGTTLTGTPSAPGTSLSSPVRIAKDDVRVKLLGGRYAAGTAFPATFFMYGQANTNGDTTALTGNGLPASRSSNDTDIEFVLPAGQTVVEWIVIGQGSTGNFFVDIDGVGTNSAGYAAPSNSSGTTYTIPITFPASASARTIRIISPWRPHGGFWVETGGTIASSTPLVSASIAWMGNSITQGAVATVVPARYQRIASRMLGIHNAVNLGVGGSGWLQDYPSPSGYNFLERMIDIYEAVNGGPPDAVVWSGGINDVGVIGTGAYTPAQVGAQALTVMQPFRELYPDIPQFVVGPFTDWNNPSYSTALYNTRDALFNAAAQVARVHTIDVSTLVTPANRDTIFNGTVNGPHPVDAGHAIYGDFIARAMAAYIERY